MNNIEKLAKREAFEIVISSVLPNSSGYDYLAKYTTEQFAGQYVDGSVQKAWVKFQALQPVATYRVQVVRDNGVNNGKPHYKDTKEELERDLQYLHEDGYKTIVTPLFTLPPSTVSLDEHNKRIAELEAEHESMVKIMALSYKALQATNKTLLYALKDLFRSYKQLVDSGDAGLWKLEETEIGEQSLKAIADAEGV